MGSEVQLDIPKPTIKRIVKEKLAGAAGSSEGAKADVQLNKEALLAFGESAKVFISYVTATANDVCKDKKRATLNAEDVFTALEETDFAELLPQLTEAFAAYKQSLKEKKHKKAEVSRKRKSAGQAGDVHDDEEAAAAAAGADTKAASDKLAGALLRVQTLMVMKQQRRSRT
ncbi:histone-fold-containing protein [Scenedesmus sp. NREL 46B-D3]|nr:histone-fold-containing protein [Scenedesmus sp. NREL 46B-D3]